MSALTARQSRVMALSEVRLCSVSFDGKLDAGESLTGTPSVDSVTGLTFSNESVSTSALTIDGATVSAGRALQFKVTASAIGIYTIPVSCGTDSTPAQTLRAKLPLIVESDS